MALEEDGRVARVIGNKLNGWVATVASLLALPAFLLTFPGIQNYLFNKEPRLAVTFRSEVPVFNGARRVRGLRVAYGQDDLAKQGRRILATSVRIRNVGGSSVLPEMIASQDPIGVGVNSGRIIEISRVRASSDHLRKLAHPSVVNGRLMYLPTGLIFDAGDFVDIDYLTVAPGSGGPSYFAMGKLAGQANITLSDNRNGLPSPSYLSLTFSGGVTSQVLRVIFYMMVGVGFLFVIVMITELIQRSRLHRESLQVHQVISSIDQSGSEQDLLKIEFLGAVLHYTGLAAFNRSRDSIAKSAQSKDELTIKSHARTSYGVVVTKCDDISLYLVRSTKEKDNLNFAFHQFGLATDDAYDVKLVELMSKVSTEAAKFGDKKLAGSSRVEFVTVDPAKAYTRLSKSL